MAHPDLQFHAQDKRYASKAEYLKSSENQALALEGSVPRAERPDEKLEGDAQTLASPTPPKSPTARRLQSAGRSRGNASSFQRLRLTDIGARLPRPPSWGHGGPGQGSFLTLPRTSLSPTCSQSAPPKRNPPDGGSAQDLASAQDPGRLLGPIHLSRPRVQHC